MRVEGGYNQACLRTVTPNLLIHTKDVFLIYWVFSFPFMKTHIGTETHAPKSLSKNSRTVDSNRAKS